MERFLFGNYDLVQFEEIFENKEQIEIGFKDVSDRLDAIQHQLEDLRKTAQKTLNLIAEMRWKDGLKRVQAYHQISAGVEGTRGTNKDLTNHSVAAKMKRGFNSDSDNTQDFNAIVNNPSTDGIITLSLTNSQTNALQVGRYLYDVEISFTDSDGATITERVLEGAIRVKPSVTR